MEMVQNKNKDDDKKLKVILSAVTVLACVLLCTWSASKGSLLTVPLGVLAVMAFQATLITKYR